MLWDRRVFRRSKISKVSDGVDLAEAIQALRHALVQAMWDGQKSRVRFHMKPIDLTVQVGVTSTGAGSAGIKWHILALGGERKRESKSAQTLRIQLIPVLLDEKGIELTPEEQLISDKVDDISPTHLDRPVQEPA